MRDLSLISLMLNPPNNPSSSLTSPTRSLRGDMAEDLIWGRNWEMMWEMREELLYKEGMIGKSWAVGGEKEINSSTRCGGDLRRVYTKSWRAKCLRRRR